MRKAYCMIRTDMHYRRDAFECGIEAAGFKLSQNEFTPRPGDLVVVWNRYGHFHDMARRFEGAGALVLVAENAYLPLGKWYALSLWHHNGAGQYPFLGNERWDSLGIEPAPWREGGSEIILLPQRGIGPSGVAMPADWVERTTAKLGRYKFRVRRHPGIRPQAVSLENDLAKAKAVVTWGSGAAIKALMMGIPCFHGLPNWIGAPGSTPIDRANFDNPQRGDRLMMLRRLIWA